MADRQDPAVKYDEAFGLAEGLRRHEIARQARQAFGLANQRRAAYRPGADPWERNAAVEAALAWRSICRFLDSTRAAVFRQADYDAWKQTTRELLRTATARIDPRRQLLVRKLARSRKPVEFYPLPPEPGIRREIP